jgi:hypothetical protein
MQKTMWATITVASPSSTRIATKNSKVAMAVTTSGTTSGRAITALTGAWPRKRRSVPSAARVAIAVATSVAVDATISEFLAAAMIVLLTKTAPYQSTLKPVQIVAERLALKLRAISTTTGR